MPITIDRLQSYIVLRPRSNAVDIADRISRELQTAWQLTQLSTWSMTIHNAAFNNEQDSMMACYAGRKDKFFRATNSGNCFVGDASGSSSEDLLHNIDEAVRLIMLLSANALCVSENSLRGVI